MEIERITDTEAVTTPIYLGYNRDLAKAQLCDHVWTDIEERSVKDVTVTRQVCNRCGCAYRCRLLGTKMALDAALE